MKCLVDYYSDVGGRSNNEDSCFVDMGERGLLLIVADGLGGHDMGEVASAMAVNCIRDDFFGDEDFDIVSSIARANAIILEKQRETGLKMKTTLSIAWVKSFRTVLAHVGDSRIYAFKEDSILFQSADHSSSGVAAAAGDITLDMIRSHPDRNILTRAIGGNENVRADITELNTADFDSLLICSDGFWEYVLEKEMIAEKNSCDSPDKWIEKMRSILRTRVPKNHDNNTCVALMKTTGKEKL